MTWVLPSAVMTATSCAPDHHDGRHVVVEEDGPEEVALFDADVGGELGRLAFVF